MEKEQAKKIVEALLYMTDHALSISEIAGVIDQKSFSDDDLKAIIGEIREHYDTSGSALRVVEIAGGYQVATRPEMASWIRRMYKERLTVRLSPSALETLSIIAYKQPITRGDVEQIRGVEASGVMETLLERRLVKVVGRKETIGRPLLYGTTVEFLRHFGLRHLSELPDLATMEISPVTPADMDQQDLPINLETNGLAEQTQVESESSPVATAVLDETPIDALIPPPDTNPELN